MDFREAFLRLKKKDKVILGLFCVLGFSLVITVFFLAANGLFFGKATFPNSPANAYGNVQQKKTPVYEDLPKTIVFPETKTCISIGGEEIGVLKDGTAFRFSEEATIIAAVPAYDANTKDFIKERFYPLLSGEEQDASCEYTGKIASKGYYNATYLSYEGGVLKTPLDETYYVLTYRKEEEEGVSPLIGVVTTNEERLNHAMTLLNRMWETMDTYEAPVEEALKEEKSGIEYYRTKAPEEGENDTSERKEVSVEELMAQRDDQMHQTAFGEAEFIEKSIVIPEEWTDKEVLFYFEYENIGKEPDEIVLISPSGEQCLPSDIRPHSGQVYFRILHPEQGVWEMRVSNNTVFGQYRLNAMPELAGDTREEVMAGEKDD